MTNNVPDMLAYVKRCQKSWARVLEARNLLASKNRGISKILGLLDDAIKLLEQNLEIDSDDIAQDNELNEWDND